MPKYKFNRKDDTHKQSEKEQWIEKLGGVRIADVSDSKTCGFDELVSFHGLLACVEYKTLKKEELVMLSLTDNEKRTYGQCNDAGAPWYVVQGVEDVAAMKYDLQCRVVGGRANMGARRV